MSIQCQGKSELKQAIALPAKEFQVSANKRQICKKEQGVIVYNVQIMAGERMPLLLAQITYKDGKQKRVTDWGG
jgi:hypothetical protein